MRTDYFGNRVCFFSIQEIHQCLEITSECVVTVTHVTRPAASLSPSWEKVAALFRDPVSPEVVEPYQFCFDSPLLANSPELAEYARASFSKDTPLLVGVLDLNRRIFTDFKYDPQATTVATPLEEVWAKRRGVCQDFAHLGIACLRSAWPRAT
jgi:transglutaminase-like putative cysteine protease